MEKGKAKTDKASPPCLSSSRLDIFFVSVICFLDVCRFLKLHITVTALRSAGHLKYVQTGTVAG